MTRSEMLSWLRERDPARLKGLWERADAVRREHVGEGVHLRGLIEVSNYCRRSCGYCGLRSGNSRASRYRMTADETAACARRAAEAGFGTVVLQAGEDPALDEAWTAGVVRRIKSETGLAVTLSLGERSRRELEAWREAGADRYLLRFETSNLELFARIHPPHSGGVGDRVEMLRTLRELGYEVGSGVMIGIPGQSYEDLAGDIELFGELDLDMIGTGPFVPHPDTPLGAGEAIEVRGGDQASSEADVVYTVTALARLTCPLANIPSTTASATLHGADGQMAALKCGANVIMPNVTPAAYRRLYQIYPDKACNYDESAEGLARLRERIEGIGRTVGRGRGDSPNVLMRGAKAGDAIGRRT